MRGRNGHGRGFGGRRGEDPGTLAVLRAGDEAVIAGIHDDCARAQAVRFGMGVGASVHCVTTLPGGPVVLRSGRQEIAVGRGLARRIRIETADERR
ncbi:MAG: ferrous iron transport protein A [Coriobacteriia bacterium]|nr:ferrous iron transport protein A [Coriobacteriia bacterium]